MSISQEYSSWFSRVTANGWLSYGEGLTLIKYADKTQGDMVEVGSYYGRSAMLLSNLNRRLYCVDPWDDNFDSDMSGEDIYQQFILNTQGTKVIPVRCRVEDWEPVPAEFVYLDGDHTYKGTVRQIEQALKCNPVFVVIHDVSNSTGGTKVTNATADTLSRRWDDITETLAVWKIR